MYKQIYDSTCYNIYQVCLNLKLENSQIQYQILDNSYNNFNICNKNQIYDYTLVGNYISISFHSSKWKYSFNLHINI